MKPDHHPFAPPLASGAAPARATHAQSAAPRSAAAPHGAADSPVGAQLLDRIVRLNRWVAHHTTWAVPLAQARVLSQLSDLGPSRIGDLARAEHCSQPTLTTLVQRLQEQALVERTPDPDDARATRISLTPAGRRALARLRHERAQVIDSLIQALDPAQRHGLQDALRALSGLLDAAYRQASSQANQTSQVN
ncbi:MarR family winged helix-turn-helix transcriptional regulator [Castellaniella caeni]|uniref:MarR family winged helix-turn-helix transcriptional regulator n=1 Tax=Castellaniella caeni TaxID=266123 RepID=UPI0009FE79C5|nr:MarR family transcriptional regulator [Castellaniella caeni]